MKVGSCIINCLLSALVQLSCLLTSGQKSTGLRERRGRERGDEDRQETDGWGTFLKSRAKTLGSLIKGSILYKVRLPCLLWLLSSSRLYIITVKVSKCSTHREMLTDLFQKLKHRLELCEVLRSQQRRGRKNTSRAQAVRTAGGRVERPVRTHWLHCLARLSTNNLI